MHSENDRLVRSEHLNHHGTLFAGTVASWFVETCFTAAARLVGRTDSVVCLKIHGLRFDMPCHPGDLFKIEARVAYVGRTSIRVHGRAYRNSETRAVTEGFVTFVTVDENGTKMEHGAKLPPPKDDYESVLRSQAEAIR
ncbi:MAG: hotdog domain-containing protein [Candidatus Sumerlaeia bacterium]|nr:hotdog domain-containing protein [Candidatus Sumerlaeia bacterium]